MAKVKLLNVDQKFKNVRNDIPGLSEDLYLLTDYISSVVNYTSVPSGLVICLLTVIDDINKGRNGLFGSEFPEILKERKEQVLQQVVYIPQIVDEIADKEFASEFRKIYDEIFEVKSNVHIDTKVENEYPENILVAIEWWANAIQAPRYTSEVPSFVAMFAMQGRPQRTAEEINTFKNILANGIMEELNKRKRCNLSVDYHPCEILMEAGNAIGLDDMLDYPFKTAMDITANEVSVYSQAGRSVLWTSSEPELKLK